MKKDFNYYMDLHWTYHLEWNIEDDCYIVSVIELPGCMSDGETIEEAMAMIKDALESYLTCLLNNKDEIPEPVRPENFKGNISYRTTPEKHYKIARKAALKGKSLNKFIDEALDQIV